MTYKQFEGLPVWQEAAKLYEQTDDFLVHAAPRLRPSFRDQLERAVFTRFVHQLDVEPYRNARVVVKGCSKVPSAW